MCKVNAGGSLTECCGNAEQRFGHADVRVVDDFGGFFGNGAADVAGKLVQHVGQEFFVGVTRRQLNRLVFFAVADVEIGYDLQRTERHFHAFVVDYDFVMTTGLVRAVKVIVQHAGVEMV